MNRGACPTCGGRWTRLTKRGRKKVRMLPARYKGERPKDSLRVYWPVKYGWIRCPDPFHDYSTWDKKPDQKKVVYGPPKFTAEDIALKRERRKRRHRKRQNKDRR